MTEELSAKVKSRRPERLAFLTIMVVCVTANILMNAIAIPYWGALGAAWTTVVSESILAGWLLWLVRHGTRKAARGNHGA